MVRDRRNKLLAAALEAFKIRGYEGTSLGDIVVTLGMSRADFGYHFDSKEQLLIDLVEPLLDEIDEALDRFPRHPSWPGEGQELLAAYLDVLIEYRDVIIWIDGDKAVLEHPKLGARLDESNRRLRVAIRGDNRSVAARLGASAVLGALWRPLRNMKDIDAAREKDAMLAVAMAVVTMVRAE
jgi:AcrR family transcriptional regulator